MKRDAKVKGEIRSNPIGARVVNAADKYRDAPGVSADRVRTFIVSTIQPALDAGVLIPDGMDSTMYVERPVVLWDHDASEVGIGRCLSLNRITTPVDGWSADIEFAPADVNEDADAVLRFIDWAGFGASSIRFIVTDMVDQPSPEDLVRYGLPRWGWIGRKWQLLEISVVNVQADPGAIMQGVKDGAYSQRAAETILRHVRGIIVNPIPEGDAPQPDAQADPTDGGMTCPMCGGDCCPDCGGSGDCPTCDQTRHCRMCNGTYRDGCKTRAGIATLAEHVSALRDAVIAHKAAVDAAQAHAAVPTKAPETTGDGVHNVIPRLVEHYLGDLEKKAK